MMTVSAFSAASVSAAENTAPASQMQPDGEMMPTHNVKMGKVTAVSGSKITVAVGGTMGTPPEKPSGNNSAPDGNGTPPEKPSGNNSAPDGNGAPPEKPSGNNSAPDGNDTPPEKPSGNNSAPDGNGAPPEMPSGEKTETITITLSDKITVKKNGQNTSASDIKKDDLVMIVYNDSNEITEIDIMDMNGGGMGKPGGMSQEKSSVELSGKLTADGTSKSIKSQKITSGDKDKSAVLSKNGGKISLDKCTITKSGDSTSVDSSNFYALNAAVAAQSGSTVTVSGGTISTDAEGSNAVFATGENSKITVKNTTIHTKGNSSRGLDATYGGTVTASKVKITTEGAHCAPLATDRGGGTIKASSSKLYASGDGSPCIYSTGDITAVNCTGKATGSQIAVVEGKNSITLSKCTLTGAGKDGVMLYQSTSGDAEVGTAVFTSRSSTLETTSGGPMFYITNTDAVINLKNTKLVFDSGVLLKASGNNTNNWGTPGKNGGNVTLNASAQKLAGDILCDEISSVKINLSSKSEFTGSVDTENTGDVSVTLDKSSVWNVTADSYVTDLTDADTSFSNIISNGHTIYYSNKSGSLGGKTISLPDGGKLVPVK